MSFSGDLMRSNTFTVTDVDALVTDLARHHISLSVDSDTPDDWHDIAGRTTAPNTLTLRAYAGMPTIDPSTVAETRTVLAGSPEPTRSATPQPA